jgi:hypothetical protein
MEKASPLYIKQEISASQNMPVFINYQGEIIFMIKGHNFVL